MGWVGSQPLTSIVPSHEPIDSDAETVFISWRHRENYVKEIRVHTNESRGNTSSTEHHIDNYATDNLGRAIMADILQMTFWKHFAVWKSSFYIKFISVELINSSHWFNWWIAVIRQQTITWTSDDHYHYIASVGNIEWVCMLEYP